MSVRRSRIPIAAVMSASVLSGLAVAESSRATTPVTVVQTSVVTTAETARDDSASADSATSLPVNSAAVLSWEPSGIEWTELRPGLEEGYLDVPIDYAHPDDGMLRLYLTRSLADDPDARVGSLLVNPGGPGFGGTDFVKDYASQLFDFEVLDAFDIVGFDPRGTGRSEPAIDCVDDYDHFYASADITPDDDAERQQIVDLAEEFADACVANNAEIIQFVGTNNAARDIDSIRRALGEDEISYVGFSYGSELGGAWATMFPTTVRAAVFDAAPDAPTPTRCRQLILAVRGRSKTPLTTYLAQCSADSRCAFHNDGDAEGAFDELMLRLDAAPIPSVEGRPSVTRGVALNAVAQAMYGDSQWPELSVPSAAAQRGDGAGCCGCMTRTSGTTVTARGATSWRLSRPSAAWISTERLSVAEDDATVPMFTRGGTPLRPAWLRRRATSARSSLRRPIRVIEITGDGAGPILVCGATGDTATPLQGTRAMADALEDSYLIVVDAISNGCSGVSRCADDLITDYLVDLDLPAAAETDCSTA